MLPEFGSSIPGAVFEQNDDALIGVLRESVQTAIERWDDRIEFVDFVAVRSENKLTIKVIFQNVEDPLSAGPQMIELDLTPTLLGKL